MPNLNSPSVEPTPGRHQPSRRRDTTESLERLLEGAQSTFVERGYHAANVHEICARSNVGIGTFYAHFDHKHDLLKRLFLDRMLLMPALLDLVTQVRLARPLEHATHKLLIPGTARGGFGGV